MQRPTPKHFTPPAHPNWTGRSYRNSHEAFGAWWQPSQPKEAGTMGWALLIVVAAVLLTLLISVSA